MRSFLLTYLHLSNFSTNIYIFNILWLNILEKFQIVEKKRGYDEWKKKKKERNDTSLKKRLELRRKIEYEPVTLFA